MKLFIFSAFYFFILYYSTFNFLFSQFFFPFFVHYPFFFFYLYLQIFREIFFFPRIIPSPSFLAYRFWKSSPSFNFSLLYISFFFCLSIYFFHFTVFLPLNLSLVLCVSLSVNSRFLSLPIWISCTSFLFP